MLYWEFFFFFLKKAGSRNNDEIFGDLTEYLRLWLWMAFMPWRGCRRVGDLVTLRSAFFFFCCCFFVVYHFPSLKNKIADCKLNVAVQWAGCTCRPALLVQGERNRSRSFPTSHWKLIFLKSCKFVETKQAHIYNQSSLSVFPCCTSLEL